MPKALSRCYDENCTHTHKVVGGASFCDQSETIRSLAEAAGAATASLSAMAEAAREADIGWKSMTNDMATVVVVGSDGSGNLLTMQRDDLDEKMKDIQEAQQVSTIMAVGYYLAPAIVEFTQDYVRQIEDLESSHSAHSATTWRFTLRLSNMTLKCAAEQWSAALVLTQMDILITAPHSGRNLNACDCDLCRATRNAQSNGSGVYARGGVVRSGQTFTVADDDLNRSKRSLRDWFRKSVEEEDGDKELWTAVHRRMEDTRQAMQRQIDFSLIYGGWTNITEPIMPDAARALDNWGTTEVSGETGYPRKRNPFLDV